MYYLTQLFKESMNMTFELYEALRSIGVDEQHAKKSAKALIVAIDCRIAFKLNQQQISKGQLRQHVTNDISELNNM